MNENKKNSNNTNKTPMIFFIVVSLVLTVGLNYLLTFLTAPPKKEIFYNDFLTMVEEGKVDSVEIQDEKIIIYQKEEDRPKEETIVSLYAEMLSPKIKVEYYTGKMDDPGLVEFLKENEVKFHKTTVETNIFVEFLVSWVLPIAIMYLFFGLIMRSMGKKMGSGGIMGIGQSNAKMYMENKTGVTFQDVAGQSEAKESLDEIVDFLHNPAKYMAIGA